MAYDDTSTSTATNGNDEAPQVEAHPPARHAPNDDMANVLKQRSQVNRKLRLRTATLRWCG